MNRQTLIKYSIIFLITMPLSTKSEFSAKDRVFVDFDTSMEFQMGEDNYQRKINRLPLRQSKELMAFLRNIYERNNLSKIKQKPEPIIPTIFHQIWLGPNKPPAIFKESQESIRKLHPDWQYKLWTDKDIPGLNLHNKKYYDLSKNYGEIADIVRYEILYKFGGVYLDVDFVCLRPFDILNHSYDFYTSLMPLDCEDTLCNGVIASVPGHPILKDCIETIEEDWQLSKSLIIRVGPYHFQKSFAKIASESSGRHIAFPKSYFFPINYKDKKKCRLNPELVSSLIKREAFAVHHWAHTWVKAKVK